MICCNSFSTCLLSIFGTLSKPDRDDEVAVLQFVGLPASQSLSFKVSVMMTYSL